MEEKLTKRSRSGDSEAEGKPREGVVPGAT